MEKEEPVGNQLPEPNASNEQTGEATAPVIALAESNTDTTKDHSKDDNKQQNMEIHTHGHIHEKKKWKEYLFQFLMLFLAVTASFFVENQREHYLEHQRAHILAASLVQNLKDDIKEIEGVIATSDSLIINNNILIDELNKPRALQNDSLIHRNGLQKIARFNVFDPSSGNYDQVKYSGALRYFKPEIVNRLTTYETDKNYLLKIAQNYLDFGTQTLIPFCITHANPRFLYATLHDKPIPNPVFPNPPSNELFDQIYRYALYINSQNKQQIAINTKHRQLAEELITLLNKTYELEEDSNVVKTETGK